MCIGRISTFSVCYTLHVSCLFTKSQKLIKAFTSKIRLNPTEVRRTVAVQILTVFILIASTNFCLLFTLMQIKPEMKSYTNESEMIRFHHCNTHLHQNIQILLLMVFQLTCSTQAYRCRKLPDVLNEAMSLFYTILVTSVSLGVSFPISYFRRYQTDKEFLNMIILIINCYVTLALLYGRKCYIMLFQPAKNTKHYFNKKRMGNADGGVLLNNQAVRAPIIATTEALEVTISKKAGKDKIVSENTTEIPDNIVADNHLRVKSTCIQSVHEVEIHFHG